MLYYTFYSIFYQFTINIHLFINNILIQNYTPSIYSPSIYTFLIYPPFPHLNLHISPKIYHLYFYHLILFYIYYKLTFYTHYKLFYFQLPSFLFKKNTPLNYNTANLTSHYLNLIFIILPFSFLNPIIINCKYKMVDLLQQQYKQSLQSNQQNDQNNKKNQQKPLIYQSHNQNIKKHILKTKQYDLFSMMKNLGLIKLTSSKQQSQNPFNYTFYVETIHIYHQIQYTINFIINLQLHRFQTKVHLLQNAIPFKIQAPQLRGLMIKYINKINAKIRYGNIALNLFNGQIYFKFQNYLTINQFIQILTDQQKLNIYIKQEAITCKDYIDDILQNILEVLQVIPQDFIIMDQKKKGNNKKLKILKQKQILQENTINSLNKILILYPFYLKFMKSSLIKEKIEYEDFQLNLTEKQDCKLKVNYIKCNLQLIKQNKCMQNLQKIIINLVQRLQILQKLSQNSFKQQEFKSYAKYLINLPVIPFPNLPLQSIYILSKIKIFNFQKVSSILNDRENKTNLLQLQFSYNFMSQKKMKNIFYLKKGNVQKMKHQRKILQQIEKQNSAYIGKYYYTDIQQFNNFILMDYYNKKTLQHYRFRNSFTFTLTTKLFFIFQIIQGLIFLKNHSIIHFDLKHQNIIISKNLTLKLIDFGQSYHPKVCSLEYIPGYTMPFACPQIFSQNRKYSEKSDVFSLGILIHQLLFDSFPFTVQQNSYQKLILFYRKNLQHDFKQIKKDQYIKNNCNGPSQLMHLIKSLCYKCLHIDPNTRPHLEWILFFMRESIIYLDKRF